MSSPFGKGIRQGNDLDPRSDPDAEHARPGGKLPQNQADQEVQGDDPVTQQHRRDQLEASRAGQSPPGTGSDRGPRSGGDEELVLVDEVESVASLPLPRSTPAGVASLSFHTLEPRSPARWWLLAQGKSLRVEEATYFGVASILTAHLRIRLIRIFPLINGNHLNIFLDFID